MSRIQGVRSAAFAAIVAMTAGCAAEDAAAGGQAAEEAAVTVAESEAPAAALNDPQIAHIAVTANAIDISMAELVESRSSTPEVQAFARTMITDHTAVNEQAGALAQRLGVVPEDNPVSQSLQGDADATETRLAGLEGAEFDRAYIEREVGYHAAVLDAIDQTLLPAVTNPDLRALLQQVRPAIAAHLEHARTLQGSLGRAR